MNRDELFAELKRILIEMFEIDPDRIVPEARLYEDLDIDSIDAVDLVIRLKEITGRKVDPAEFKAVRTVDDVVNVTANLFGDQ